MQITASQLYDHVSCPRRVTLDAFGDQGERDAVSPFVRMLWERGSAFEGDVFSRLPGGTALLGDREGDRQAATLAAMDAGVPMIQGGRIAVDDLLGDPDLLIRVGDAYMPADVKSGRGEDGDGDGAKLKPHYAVQVSLYVDILERMGRSAGRFAEIWDVRGERVRYELGEARGSRDPQTWWDFYSRRLGEVRAALAGDVETRGALAASCGLCHWHSVCRRELEAADDLTLIPSLGRALRDRMMPVVSSVGAFATCDPDALVQGKRTAFPGLGPERLRLFQARARLLSDPDARPYLRAPVELPVSPLEVFFDIEADPMRDLVYLHGFVERRDHDPATDRFTGIFAEGATAEDERRAFAEAMAFLAARPEAVVYYYSKYERTMYRKLQSRYPDVCGPDEVEALFTYPRSVDLYFDVVTKATEWPTRNHSIKTLAKYLGFAWRDTDPSGAASIEWYHRWVETGDTAVRQRIVDYNEDDCRATIVLLDGIRALA
ncbi:MAG: TM0106 family RecB-like putative nuclease [Sphingomonas sp.]|uniref:TM0106 family RecB-like putative nuclease n=1 Tax=Sphingomonas sp. TaxID=28214 RepID=UPI0012212C0E|nr:TM0106 family RecB-like putative nuclease [Sphingomonas sp.]THD34478.1 MAG: TM0106 family RecB-like putative nuclease [Sphingomonas sp.]